MGWGRGNGRFLCILVAGMLLFACRIGADDVDSLLSEIDWHDPLLSKGEEVFGPKKPPELPPCANHRIGVLDLGTFAFSNDLAPCSMLSVAGQEDVFKGMYSGPYHLKEAIKGSQYYEENLDDADIIFVYDYCFYATGLTFKQEVLGVDNQPRTGEAEPSVGIGLSLIESYEMILETPRWQRNWGADYVFYDSHAGFSIDGSGIPMDKYICTSFRNATFLTNDRMLRAETCHNASQPPLPKNKVIVVPHVAQQVDPKRPDAHLKEAALPYDQRDELLNKRTFCQEALDHPIGFDAAASSHNLAGKRLHAKLGPIMADSDGQIDCDNLEVLPTARPMKLGGGWVSHFDETYYMLERSVFCLFLPGDAGFGHRLSEAMMAGCIPAFVGPPYHQMPFLEDVNYRTAAVFFNVTDRSSWDADDHTDPSAPVSGSALDITEASIAERTIAVETLEDIEYALQAIPGKDVERRLVQMAKVRTKFNFASELTHIPNAVNVMLAGVCRRSGNKCLRSVARKEMNDIQKERCRRSGIAVE